MSDYDDRGAYTPPADRLAFDPRQPVRGGGPAPVTLIVSGLVLISMVGGVFFLYRDGFRHRGEAPALVGAPVAEARMPAAAPDASNDAPPGLVVDKTTAPAPAPAFAPPAAHQLPPQLASASSAPRAASAVAPAALAAASPSVAARPAVAAPKVVMLAPDAAPAAVAAPPKKVVTAPAAATHLAAAAPPTAKPVAHHAAPVTIASLTDDALDHRARPARDADAHNVRLAEAVKPTAVAAHHVVAAHIKGAPIEASPMRAAAAPAPGWVQIGAFSTPTLADQGWRDVARMEPDFMSGKGKAVQSLVRDDGSTLYRTYVTGFSSVSAAQSFCDDLRAAGKSCMVK
jgi:SPOR domain